MGIRGELYSTRVSCNGRTYFFNVKENRMGDMFLTVVESKPTETEGFERRSVVVFREDMTDFVKAFQDALSFMEKPEQGKKALDFSPAKGAAKKTRTHEGFTGSESAKAGSGGPETKKRRIVVRKKPSATKDRD
jgi:hypothetical protein